MDVRSFVELSPQTQPLGSVGESDSDKSSNTWIFVLLGVAAVGGLGAYLYSQGQSGRKTPAALPAVEDVWTVTLSASGPKGFDPYPKRKRYHFTDALGDFREIAQDQAAEPAGDGWRGIDSVSVVLLDPQGHEVERRDIPAPKAPKASKPRRSGRRRRK